MARPQKQLHKPAEAGPPPRRLRAAAIGIDTVQLGRAAFERAGFAEQGLVLRWREIVGAEAARMARPLRLSDGPAGGVLTLKAEPAAALFLQHESRALCARINSWLGRPAVQKLRFVPGELAPEPAPSHPRYPQDFSPHDPARRFAGPDGLKDALLALAKARHTLGPR
ncbi:MAG: DciA family protein [Rhizomicrobium sp.]